MSGQHVGVPQTLQDGALWLYSVFHCNLEFSSIPEAHAAHVVDTCYWPLLDLVQKRNVAIGIEFPGKTLEKIAGIDAEWVSALSALWSQGKCEVIGSGYVQSIFPLVPERVNQVNLQAGHEVYERLLGRKPSIAYVHEQAFSAGIVPLYLEAGYRAVFMEWNNPYKYNRFDRGLQYRPQWIGGPDGSRISVVWNNSISFQKFQRYAEGSLSLADLISFLESHHVATGTRLFPLYGSDAEIFDYRPGEEPKAGRAMREEWDRIEALYDHLQGDHRFRLVTPSQALDAQPPLSMTHLESPEYPIPCKKQEKYNVTRWAVAGRENIDLNTRCYRLFEGLRQLEAMRAPLNASWRELSYLWASDFRTHTTEDKFDRFRDRLGALCVRVEEARDRLLESVPAQGDFLLINAREEAWEGNPVEVLLTLPPGRYFGSVEAACRGEVVLSQVEHATCHSDGSLRMLRLVLSPHLQPYEVAPIVLRSNPVAYGELRWASGDAVETDAVKCEVLPLRGGAIKELLFKNVAPEPLLGTLPHGYFEDIAFAADFYSGHAIIAAMSGERFTDLEPAQVEIPEDLERFPIRIPIRCSHSLGVGSLTKTYSIYRRVSRIDVDYSFRLKELRTLFFRLGIVTLMPTSFRYDQLEYATVNGGAAVERFRLAGRKVAHDENVSTTVTASHCLGATEGWVSLGDDRVGVGIITPKTLLYSAPMVHFEPVDDKFFLRLYHSIGESDDTSRVFWRGHRRFSLTLLGHRNDLGSVRSLAAARQSGLWIKGGAIPVSPC